MLSDTPRMFIGTTTFNVTGMKCEHCTQAVAEAIRLVEGVTAITVDFASATVTVTAAQPVDRADIARAIEAAGFILVP